MARGSLPASPARIFTRRPSLWSRVLGGALLALSLLVTLAGLATAIYLERASDRAPAAVASADRAAGETMAAEPATAALPAPDPATATGQSRDPLAAAAAIPSPPPATESPLPLPPSPVIEAKPAETPSAGSSALRPPGPATELAALEAPAATGAAAPLDSERRYWVEFGVFVGERYARRLQQALALRGLAATVVDAPAPGGRTLRRVRSAASSDYATARALASRAEAALGIGTLIHRAMAPPLPATAVAASPPRQPGADRRYWVQFGAFPRQQQAMRLQETLGQGGIDTVLSTMRAKSGRLLYVVRSIGLGDEESALALAHRGREAANVEFLVGRSLAPHPSAMAAAPHYAADDRGKASPR